MRGVTHYDTTMVNGVAGDAHCDITMGNDVTRDIHYDVTMSKMLLCVHDMASQYIMMLL